MRRKDVNIARIAHVQRSNVCSMKKKKEILKNSGPKHGKRRMQAQTQTQHILKRMRCGNRDLEAREVEGVIARCRHPVAISLSSSPPRPHGRHANGAVGTVERWQAPVIVIRLGQDARGDKKSGAPHPLAD
jgi:hypothetical protein